MKVGKIWLLSFGLALSGCQLLSEIERGAGNPENSWSYKRDYWRILDNKMDFRDATGRTFGCLSDLKDASQQWDIATLDKLRALDRRFQNDRLPPWLHNRLIDVDTYWAIDHRGNLGVFTFDGKEKFRQADKNTQQGVICIRREREFLSQ